MVAAFALPSVWVRVAEHPEQRNPGGPGLRMYTVLGKPYGYVYIVGFFKWNLKVKLLGDLHFAKKRTSVYILCIYVRYIYIYVYTHID